MVAIPLPVPPAIVQVLSLAELTCQPGCCGLGAHGLSAAHLVPWVARAAPEEFVEVCKELEAFLEQVRPLQGRVLLYPRWLQEWDAQVVHGFFTALLHAFDRALDLVQMIETLEKHAPKNMTELMHGWRFGERFPHARKDTEG